MLSRLSLPLFSLVAVSSLMSGGCNTKSSSSHATDSAGRVSVLPPVDQELSTAESDHENEKVRSRQPTRKLPSAPSPEAITESEATAFAKQLQAAVLQNDLPQFQKLIDWDGIIARSVEGGSFDETFKKGVLAPRMTASLSGKSLASIQQLCGESGSYRIVRVMPRGGKQHVVFRGIAPSGEMNFHDFEIQKRGDSIIATKFFIALTGEELADTLRNNFLLAQTKSSILNQLTSSANHPAQDLTLVAEMSKQVQADKKSEAIVTYNKLSSAGKKAKMAMLLRVTALASLDETEYLAAWDQYVEAFPGDPSLGLLGVDAAVIRKDLKQLEKCRKLIQQWTGGDPYIDLICSRWFFEYGEKERGKELFDSVDVDALDLANANEVALINYLHMDDHANALAQLKTLNKDYEVTFEDIENNAYFERFVKTDEYREWKSFVEKFGL